MSKYTTELRFIVESYNDNKSSDNKSADEFIEKALPKLFNFNFPIYDENYRNTLELKIVRHFYTREICCETVGRWKMFLRDRLNMIMPYYNDLYKSATFEFNPLYDHNLTTSFKKEANGSNNDTMNSSNNQTTNNSSTDWSLHSDTPQGAISDVDAMTYLSDATKGTDKSEQNTNGSASSNAVGTYKDTESYTQTVQGLTQLPSEALNKYRETLINIDQMIINELDDLFFGLW